MLAQLLGKGGNQPPLNQPDSAYQPGFSALVEPAGMAQENAWETGQAAQLGMERPIWGQDYLGPASASDQDLNAFHGATPYEQGRSAPAELLRAMTPEQEENYGGDQGFQELTGMDPYGNPLPPTWSQPPPAPFSDEEDARYGYAGQGDAYDNPRNPNYWLNNLGPAKPGQAKPGQPGTKYGYPPIGGLQGLQDQLWDPRRKF
jgi:hypothetical protein